MAADMSMAILLFRAERLWHPSRVAGLDAGVYHEALTTFNP